MDNLVFHPDRPEVLAVLGWKLAALGDPIADLANSCMAYFLPPHFSALRGTESGKATSDTQRRELEPRNRFNSCPESSADGWAPCSWEELCIFYRVPCSPISPFPKEPCRMETSFCMCSCHCSVVTPSPVCFMSVTHLSRLVPSPCS